MQALPRVLFAGLVLLGMGCTDAAQKSITLATTTSTRDTGLLDELLPIFKNQTGIEVRVVAVGTGQALEIGRRGDADVILTHDPAGEEKFVSENFGKARFEVMSNDFVLAGPPDDPARVRDAQSGSEAFVRVAESSALFISRGDDSGTHRKEMATWKAAGIVPHGDWYVQSGQGMGAVLRMADEKRGYAFSDRGTFLSQREKLHLVALYAGDPAWVNRYAVIPINPDKHAHARYDWARQFVDFLQSDETQRRIADFGQEKYGEALFRAKTATADSGQ